MNKATYGMICKIDNLTINDIIFLIKVLDINICAMTEDNDESHKEDIASLRKLKFTFSNMLMEILDFKNKSKTDYKEEA